MKQQGSANISNTTNGTKQQQGSNGTGGSKPNAWIKPLQGAPKKGAPLPPEAPAAAGTGKPSGAGSRKVPPPGLSKQHNAEKTNVNLTALRERYLHLLLTLTGQKVTATLKSGVQYTGVLHTATPFSHLAEAQRRKYVLKAVTVSGEVERSSVKPGQTVLLDMADVVQLHVKSCRLDALVATKSATAANSDAFTDTEISGAAAGSVKNKDFVSADAGWTSAGEKMAVNSRAAKLAGNSGGATAGALKGSIAGWDQFKANEELFNVVGTFDETIYTTALDYSQISSQERQRAELLAREIESTASSNLHVAEERGQVMNQDYDEEDRYSGVLTTAKPNLNYAQAVAAANADPAPPGFADTEAAPAALTESSPKTVSELKPGAGATTVSAVSEPKNERDEKVDSEQVNKKETVTGQSETKEAEMKPAAEVKSTKLSANAKSFSFNINAKTFTPTPLPPPPPPPPQFVVDPASGLPMMLGGPMMPGGTCYLSWRFVVNAQLSHSSLDYC